MDKKPTIREVLTRGVAEVLPDRAALEKLMAKRKITLYQGFDPSMPSLHLGNYVGLLKLSQFQRLGHKVIFLVGDFTGMIGDPTDKSATRKKLTREETLKNAKAWSEQAGRILKFDGANAAEIKFNSQWLDKVTFKELIEIASTFTVQQLIERDMFQERIKDEAPIHLHEFLYPVAQGYDSVVMDVDLEIGGSDQLFNMLAGRTLMKAVKGKEKFVLTTKLLVDKEGNKVGKTTGNALFMNSSPDDFYAGIMSFPDEVVALGFELLTECELSDLAKLIEANPMREKMRLAYEVVKIIWGTKSAVSAQDTFAKTFQKREPVYTREIEGKGSIVDTVGEFIGSRSQAKRLLIQKAIDLNGQTVTEPDTRVSSGDKLRIGKKDFVRII